MNASDRPAAVYARRAAAAEDTAGLTAQIARARQAAEGLGLAVAADYADDGTSGLSRFADRPAGRRLLADIGAGRVSDVIVDGGSRLGRSARVVADAVRAIERAGASVHGVEETAVWPW